MPFKENQAFDQAISIYATSKQSGELFTRMYHNLYELDVINLLRSVRELKTLNSIVMSKHQILLVKYQQGSLLHTSSSDAEIDLNLNVVELSEHKDERVRNTYQNKLKECLETYGEKLESHEISEIDSRILKGIINRKHNKYALSFSNIKNSNQSEVCSNISFNNEHNESKNYAKVSRKSDKISDSTAKMALSDISDSMIYPHVSREEEKYLSQPKEALNKQALFIAST